MPSQDQTPFSCEGQECNSAKNLTAFDDCFYWSAQPQHTRACPVAVRALDIHSSPSKPSPRLLTVTPHSGHEEYCDKVNKSRCIHSDSAYNSPDEMKVTRRQEHLESECTSTNPKPGLGAQTTGDSSGTAVKANLLPTVIAEALNSRAVNPAACSHLNKPSAFFQSAAHLHATISDQKSKMGYYEMNQRKIATISRNGRSLSYDQSQNNDQVALAQPTTVQDEKSQMTNHNNLKSANHKAPVWPLGTFNPDAYGKPDNKRHTFQGHTSRQGSITLPKPVKELSTLEGDPTSPKGVLGSPTHPESAVIIDDPAGHSPIALPEESSVADSPTCTMPKGTSRANNNGGSERVPRRNGRPRIDENAKPGNIDAIVTEPIKSPETQQQKLERLQTQLTTKIGHKIRLQGIEPTTSPQTLSIARQVSSTQQADGVLSQTPKTTKVTTPSTMNAALTNGVKNGCTPTNRVSIQADESVLRQENQHRSVRSSTMSLRGRGVNRYQNGRNNRWATATEIKPPPAPTRSIHSNAFGSEAPDDAETASGDSVAAMDNGRLVRKNRPAGPDTLLADWKGDWMPPPVDWDTRPRYNNNSAEFIEGFGDWNENTAAHSLDVATSTPFTRLSMDLVKDPDLHPDGLNLVDPTMSVDVDTAEQYGYSGDALATIRQDARLIDPDIFTDDWGKLDLRDSENLRYKDECAAELMRNYNANKAEEREKEINSKRAQKLARRREGPTIPAPNPHTPRINIYLRPAVRPDVPQLLDIYNSYIENSVRPAELQALAYDDMMNRWLDTTNEKLPFIVAVSKSAKVNRGVDNAVEKIVGWASATDWVSRQSVERYTVELEVYVHQQHLHQGVGKCLMDKLIDSTDRGHLARKGYPFTCTPELRHGYSAGGARNLITLLMIVRNFNKPLNAKENDLPWIKKWLEEEWKFEQQGHIKLAGAKFKRFVNETTFVRSTAYTPVEGMIPEEIL